MDFWRILELEPTTDLKEIKSAYARLSKIYHPEQHPDEFRQLYQAYQTALAWQKKKLAQASSTKIEGETNSDLERADSLNFDNLSIEWDGMDLEQDDVSHFKTIKPIEAPIPTAISQEQEAELQRAKEVLERVKGMAKGKVLRPNALERMIAFAKEEGVFYHLNFRHEFMDFLQTKSYPQDKLSLKQFERIAKDGDLTWLVQQVAEFQKEAETEKLPWYKNRATIAIIIILGLIRILRFSQINRETPPSQPAQSVITEQSIILDDLEVRSIFDIYTSLEFENGQYSILNKLTDQRIPLPDVIKAYMVTAVEGEETSMSVLATKDGETWQLYNNNGSIRGNVSLGDIPPEQAKIVIEGDQLRVKHQSE